MPVAAFGAARAGVDGENAIAAIARITEQRGQFEHIKRSNKFFRVRRHFGGERGLGVLILLRAQFRHHL